MPPVRRLSAILAADRAGYSRLMRFRGERVQTSSSTSISAGCHTWCTALLQLRDDLVRPAAEVDRQHSVNIGRPPLAGDVALVEFQQRGGDPVLQREYRLARVLG
jgi:hypothetical protein